MNKTYEGNIVPGPNQIRVVYNIADHIEGKTYCVPVDSNVFDIFEVTGEITRFYLYAFENPKLEFIIPKEHVHITRQQMAKSYAFGNYIPDNLIFEIEMALDIQVFLSPLDSNSPEDAPGQKLLADIGVDTFKAFLNNQIKN
jgi:hypothetical protein